MCAVRILCSVNMDYSSKVDYDSNLWLGILTGHIIQTCIELALHRCPGCKTKLKSPLLHLHEQQSLLQKIHTYFNEVRGILLPRVGDIYDSVKHKFILKGSENENVEKENHAASARSFLTMSSPEVVYYGRYLLAENDEIISEILTKKTPRKRKNATGNREKKKPTKKDKNAKLQTPPPMNLEELLAQAYRESVTDDFNNQYV